MLEVPRSREGINSRLDRARRDDDPQHQGTGAGAPGLSVTYFGYGFFAARSFFFVKAMVDETRGRELADMAG
ncbi:hypothetical protein LK533_01125 [Sphingomonas sp. PL-96]|uniref:hypothetical protein n=1 Tax=Sphingomonas sp. PL-96 TaxID=2887201 RepID=UPI001E4E33CB|nr:hypothetical protein [Sphingomonas sp. PL-96]MCC2975273.1 hypothetical protein [Sphingomonas sp. PL-96]